MISTSTTHIRSRFRDHRLLQVLVGAYALVWVITAIAPLDRHDWWLENLLVFGVMALLIGTYRVFPLSDLSYLLIAAFLTLRGAASLARTAITQRRDAGRERPLAGPGPDELGRPQT